MLKTVKVRIYPNETQKVYLNDLFGAYRFTFNASLAYSIQYYEENKKSTSLSQLGKHLTQLRSEHHWLKRHNAKVLQQALLNLQDSYKRFFINGTGFPNFKKKYGKQSARFNNQTISKKNFSNGRLWLIKELRNIQFRCSPNSKEFLFEHKDSIRSVTISKDKVGDYFASILVEFNEEYLPKTDKTVGVDLGIKELATLSDGTVIENERYFVKNQAKLAELQQQFSRQVKGSNRREVTRKRIAKLHRKIARQRSYHIHNFTKMLIENYDIIVIEDLNVAGMLKNHRLAKHIADVSFGEIARQLDYKAQFYGKTVVRIDRWFPSSKTCSGCGWKNKNLTLADRVFVCKECSLEIDRDLNAAINIKKEGLRIMGQSNGLAEIVS